MSKPIHVRAPGRVNLIGEHTDYTGGLALPMAIDRWTVIRASSTPGQISLTSAEEPEPLDLRLPVTDAAAVRPAWGRYIAGVVAEMGDDASGFSGHVTTTVPVGAGLSSSAALELAVALASGFSGTSEQLALLCQRAEHRASGVPCGILDQLAIANAVEGHALLIDCHTLQTTPVAVPEGLDIVVKFIAHRTLVGSKYADRVHECAAAEREIGPLRLASIEDCQSIGDPIIRRRAQHVIEENGRVREFCAALENRDLVSLGKILIDGHNSLRDCFETSTAVMDEAVEALCALPGVYGARMTGGGFGGCVVALCEPGALTEGWVVRPVGAAAHL
jgi:galactokinase